MTFSEEKYEAFIKKLIEERKASGISRKEVAETLGVTQRTVRNFENMISFNTKIFYFYLKIYLQKSKKLC